MDWWKLLRRKYGTFGQFSPAERSLLLQSLLLFSLVSLSLQLWGLRRTQQLLSFLSRREKTAPLKADNCSQESIARLVAIASRNSFPRGNCLRRSLVLWYLLRRQGIESDLRFGVRREGGDFQAHAWVEREGLVLNDSQDVSLHYAPFARPIPVVSKQPKN